MDIEKITLTTIYDHSQSGYFFVSVFPPINFNTPIADSLLMENVIIVRYGELALKSTGVRNWYEKTLVNNISSMLEHRDFDLIIVMAGLDKDAAVETARALGNLRPRIPLLLLANNNSDLHFFQAEGRKLDFIDRIFVWNGNSNVFLAMIKYIEDKKNVARDTQNGNVRVVLLVEDSIQYYSRYLPMLYTTIMTQTQILVQEDAKDELHKILKMRARPKVILVDNYEEAVKIINSYRRYMLCVISDVRFEKDGKQDENAGIELLNYASPFYCSHRTLPMPPKPKQSMPSLLIKTLKACRWIFCTFFTEGWVLAILYSREWMENPSRKQQISRNFRKNSGKSLLKRCSITANETLSQPGSWHVVRLTWQSFCGP